MEKSNELTNRNEDSIVGTTNQEERMIPISERVLEKNEIKDEPISDSGEHIDDESELDSPDLSGELAKSLEFDESFGLLAGEDLSDNSIQGDTWIEELECALLADSDPSTLRKICEGRRIPSTLRPDYWRALLALNDSGKVKLTGEYDLENQLDIRQDCETLVENIAKNLVDDNISDAEKLQLKSDFESTLTTYVKARPELSYVRGNGWTDILRVLYDLGLNDTQLYQMFFRIVDRYVPKDLFKKQDHEQDRARETDDKGSRETSASGSSKPHKSEKPAQAYHLLRLLIQYHDPELCSILDSKKITPNLYVKDWFCSLFARSCSPKMALLIWDTHFKMADPFLIFFAAIVMVVNASDELKNPNMNQATVLKSLRSMPSQLEEDDIEDMYYLVSNHYTNSTPRSIRSYSHLFFMDTFGKTYLGNESPEEGQQVLDLKTSQLIDSIDLSHYLCLPIVPAEVFALDTAQLRSSPTNSNSTLKYFLVDCRSAEQYNAGHLKRAFHLDCSLMLREPSSFTTAVKALLEIQRQVVASKSNTGGQHLCFIGGGPSSHEEDQYVNMVVASFLQKYQKYVSIVVGGFEAIHDYVSTKSELKDSFGNYIVDHNSDLCKPCRARSPHRYAQRFDQKPAPLAPSSTSTAQSIFASTTNFLRGDKSMLTSAALNKLAAANPQTAATANMIAQSGASMFDKFTTAFVSRSSVIKDRLVETLNTTNLPSPNMNANSSAARDHVSSQDKLGRRYTGSNSRYAIDDNEDDLSTKHKQSGHEAHSEPVQEIQIDVWQQQTKLLAFKKCAQIKGTVKYPGYVALTSTHLWILREIPHNKGFASIAAKRPLNMVVQITSKRRQPDLIIFRYGYSNQQPQNLQRQASQTSDASQDDESNKLTPTATAHQPSLIVASDHLHIPQAFELIRLIKREIVRIMDGNRKESAAYGAAHTDSTGSPEPDQSAEKTAESDIRTGEAPSETVENDSAD